jgi:hypothetical protein
VGSDGEGSNNGKNNGKGKSEIRGFFASLRMTGIRDHEAGIGVREWRALE